jgi:N-acetylglucosamine kinase-like BadF-type ATPase
MAALAAAARSVDGRGPRTVLETSVPAHFGVTGPLELARAIHLRRIPETRLGELAPVVLAASDDDPVAAAIVDHLTDEVIALARAALQRLELTRSDVEVVLGGRVLRSVPSRVVEAIAAGVRNVASRARVLVSPSEPIVGASLLALDAVDADAAAQNRARAELDAALAGVHAQPAATSL